MKTVLITGCNRGLGRALLDTFARNGLNVVALIRKASEEFSNHIDELASAYNTTIKVFTADLTSESSINNALVQIENDGITIDVLVNNAAYNCGNKAVFNTEYSEVDDSFRINYLAPFLLSKKLISGMIDKGAGCIINITSVAGMVAEPGDSAYGASKMALNCLTKSLAQEVAPFNIRVNGVACSVIETDMFKSFDDKQQKKLTKRVALKRASSMDEVCDMVFYLASEKASFITGAIIPVDGGFV